MLKIKIVFGSLVFTIYNYKTIQHIYLDCVVCLHLHKTKISLYKYKCPFFSFKIMKPGRHPPQSFEEVTPADAAVHITLCPVTHDPPIEHKRDIKKSKKVVIHYTKQYICNQSDKNAYI